ncbi:tripartite motif-containing protein 16-like [Synchiropus splendidus]|uniref:tripartite motif-containing protein 16-like n=1 Tax=Synchiropus splendidus TaxID=270530 RepID=UPI00237E91E8|nr:tripartite motif-containing protein 16-like [Synchiropus splendidus]
MEQTRVHLQRESIDCPICLDQLEDPVTTPCGHSYCMKCINNSWDSEAVKNSYTCPQCMKKFTQRPHLEKNIVLAELVEELKKTSLEATPADHCYAGPEDVACDFCTGRRRKAHKSCLVCLVSYCDHHLTPHLENLAFRRHKLVEPSKQLEEYICSHHDEVMKIFCRTDQQVICSLCTMDQHKGHDTVSAAAARGERETEVGQRRNKLQQSIQIKEKDVKLLQQQEQNLTLSADEAVKDSQDIFNQLIMNIQTRMSSVEQQIRSKQKTENLSSVTAVPEDIISSETNLRPHSNFEEVTAAVSASRDQIQDFLRDTWTNFSLTLKQNMGQQLDAEPQTRMELLRYSCAVTVDPNTADTELFLSEGNRKVAKIGKMQSRPKHPDRFTKYSQILSKEALPGRSYWEVLITGRAEVAVSYKDISRSGDESEFGKNDLSWSLSHNCSMRHNCASSPVSNPPTFRLGVYLDHTAGLLSFYRVSETMTLLHRVQTTFNQPLYAGIWVSRGASSEFLDLS